MYTNPRLATPRHTGPVVNVTFTMTRCIIKLTTQQEPDFKKKPLEAGTLRFLKRTLSRGTLIRGLRCLGITPSHRRHRECEGVCKFKVLLL